MKRFLIRLILFMATMVLLLEGVFRTVIPASTQPFAASKGRLNIFRYDVPEGTEGIFSRGRFSEIRAHWRINNDGWVSRIRYRPRDERTRPAIAVFGNSYVEGFHVDVDSNVSAVLQRLTHDRYEVFNCGVSDASVSHYIQVSRYIRETYDPEIQIYIVNGGSSLYHSLARRGRNPVYLQLSDEGESVKELPLEPRTRGVLRRVLSHSALVRYLALHLAVQPSTIFKRPVAQEIVTTRNGGSVGKSIDKSVEKVADRRVMTYVLDTIKRENADREVVFVLDADYRRMYVTGKPEKVPVNDMIGELCKERDIPCIDMAGALAERYRRDRQRHDFVIDRHWNSHGHRVVAEIIYEELVKRGILNFADAAASPTTVRHQ
jgi:hypothetical protein